MSKILVVEDEKDIRENLELLLNSEGYDVVCAEDGLKAWQMLGKITPELIISDIMMPYMDGLELFQKVRECEKTKIIPFIFLTAKNDMSSIRMGMNLGADDYITKPFLSDDLLAAIKIRLERYDSFNKQIENICDNISKYVPHELRTPLVAIMGYSQLIISEEESLKKTEIMDMIDRINFAAKRLHNRIEKFIQFGELDQVSIKIESGETYFSEIDNDLIKEILLSNYLTKERKQDFEVSMETNFVRIPNRYLKLLLNELIENAVKFSETGKSVIVKGASKDHIYSIDITDFGTGMTADEINLLGAFKQVNREIHQQEGNGLGLEIVKNIIKYFNGQIKITSAKNSFTTISITLPTYIKE
ncbi:MAG: response regulator [bacterium]